MYYGKSLLLQLAAAATLMPAEGLNLRLLSAPDIEAVVDEAAAPRSRSVSIGAKTDVQPASKAVSLEFDSISPGERLRWGKDKDELPIGVQVQLKIELN